jgi:hypothetical protein
VSLQPNGGTVTVTITYPFALFTGYAGGTESLTIQRTVVMPVAPQAGQ